MTHLTENTIRSYVDHELPETEHAEAVSHLASCPDCRTRLEAASGRVGRVSAHLAALAPAQSESPRPAQAALAQLKDKQRKENTMLKSIFSRRSRPAWIGLAAVIALAVALTLPPVQALATNFLGLFRVQKIAVLPLDTTRISELSGDSALGKQLSQMLSDSVTIKHEPGESKAVADAAEASQAAGFTVRLPENRSDLAELTVQDGTSFEFTINRDRAQGLLDEAGHGDLQLPASLDGAVISVDIPASVTALYGGCPKITASDGDPDVSGSIGRRYFDCVFMAQIPSPTVNTPPDLDVARLAEIGLEFTGMTAEEAHNYSQTVDWASTLVIPIPRNGASYTQVSVDGVIGNLIERPTDDAPQYALIWVKGGVIYAISGLGVDSQTAFDMASSLK